MLAAPDLPAVACPTRSSDGHAQPTEEVRAVGRALGEDGLTYRASGHELAFDLHLLSETLWD